MKSQKDNNKTKKEKGFGKALWNFFSSIKLTVFLMIFLALVSIIGTLIPQNASVDEYLRHYSLSTYDILHNLGFLDVYHSWWFILLLILLCLTLAVCSIKNFPRVWKIITRDNSVLNDDKIKTLSLVVTVKKKLPLEEAKKRIIRIMQKHFGSPREVQVDETSHFFIEKAKYSRMGIYITHASVIIILIGGLIGSLFGFKANVTIVEGESADQVILQNSSLVKNLGFEVRCDDFDVTYYPDGTPKDYKSTLTIFEGGKKILSKTIEVNHPLKYKGIVFYQSSYGIASDQEGEIVLLVKKKGSEGHGKPMRVEVGGGFSLPEEGLFVKVNRFFSDFVIDEEGRAINQSYTFNNPAAELLIFKEQKLQKKIWVFQKYPDFHGSSEGDYQFLLEGFKGKEYTGLQVTKDPGVWVVWTGCTLMMMGIVFTFFFSHRQLWVRIKSTGKKLELVIAGTASKNQLAFEKEFQKLELEIRNLKLET